MAIEAFLEEKKDVVKRLTRKFDDSEYKELNLTEEEMDWIRME